MSYTKEDAAILEELEQAYLTPVRLEFIKIIYNHKEKGKEKVSEILTFYINQLLAQYPSYKLLKLGRDESGIHEMHCIIVLEKK